MHVNQLHVPFPGNLDQHLIGRQNMGVFIIVLWKPAKSRVDGQDETILVVGLSTVSELFLMSVKEFAHPRIRVAGLLVEEPEMGGRAIQQIPVLGTVEELQDTLQTLEVTE